MGREVSLGAPLGAPLGLGLGLRPQRGGPGGAPTIQVLLVGGGGAGESGRLVGPVSQYYFGNASGGGAGGQVLEIELPAPPPGAYQVKIGPGGVSEGGRLARGGLSSFLSLIAHGGGAGGGLSYDQNPVGVWGIIGGFNTGSPGRWAWGQPGQSIPPQGGFPGGLPFADGSSISNGGGGGGAGGPGEAATSSAAGAGGPGVFSSISGEPIEYGRGGTGGASVGGGIRGPLAFGLGGGGGAGRPQDQYPTVGNPGNSGILIFRYLTGTQNWIGGDVSQVGPWTVHTFTADGTATRLS